MKKLLIFIVVIVILAGAGIGIYMNDPMKISYNGKILNAECPIKEDNKYMVPAMSVLNEVFDGDLKYDIYDKTVEGRVNGDRVVINAGSKVIEIDGEEFKFSSPAVIERNVLYIPADYLKAFDLGYSYNIFTKTLEIKDR